jgi:hypothetical protein
MICFGLANPASLFAQGTPLTIGPLTVTVPAGWTGRTDTDPVRFFSPESTPQQYFSVEFRNPQTTTDDILAHHNMVVSNLSGLKEPGTKSQSGILGQFIWTRIVIRRPQSQPQTLILYSAKVGSLYVLMDVDATNADLVAKDLPAVETMIRGAVLGNTPGAPASSGSELLAPVATASPSGGSAYATQGPIPTGSASLSQYAYAVPPGWMPAQYSDGIVLTSPASATGERCQISMWPMRPTTGNPGSDVSKAFREVFKAYEMRNRDSDGSPVPTTFIRGKSGAGWDYLIVKQGIGMRGPYQTLIGSVMVANLNGTVAVVSTLSKVPLVSTCLGELASDAWPKFFYSLSFKSWVPTDQSASMSQTLAGTWTSATATASDQFTFGANGRYAGASGAQNYHLLSSGTVLTTTQAFFGDGAYSLKGNVVSMTPDERTRPPQSGLIRVEQESKDGGNTWTPILYLLRTSAIDGKEYEVRYQKTR